MRLNQLLYQVPLTLFFLFVFYQFFDWAIYHAHWSGDVSLCQDTQGACWIYVRSNFQLLMYGLYPKPEQWRVSLVMLFVLVNTLFVMIPKFNHSRIPIISFFSVLPVTVTILMYGGFGLETVPTAFWGGFSLNVLMSVFTVFFSFPIGIFLAICRQSNNEVISFFSTLIIELTRSVPLITLIFIGAVVMPYMFEQSFMPDRLIRVMAMMILFSACYFAEIIRGGIQSIPPSQVDAGKSLGFSTFKSNLFIVLPQAIMISIPPIVNQIVLIIKSTTLVTIVSIFDILTIMRSSITNLEWASFYIEAYLFNGLCFWLLCYSLTLFGRYYENFYQLQR